MDQNVTDTQYGSALSTQANLAQAVADVAREIRSQLDGPLDAVVAFFTGDYQSQWVRLGEQLADALGTDRVLGCSAEGVIGPGREVEEGPGLVVWAARWPQATVHAFHLEFQRTMEGSAFVGWPDELDDAWSDGDTLLLLADPYSFPADYLLERLNDDHPGCAVLGGLASAASRPGDNCLLAGRQSYSFGAVGWLLRQVPVRPVVSQGCRPIGEPFVVTGASGNLITHLGGKPAIEQLHRIFRQLPTHEQDAVQRGLHVGRVVSEYLEEFQMGDFLIRNVMGLDHETGAIAVGDFIRPGTTVQFHLRDEHAADHELKTLLARQQTPRPPQAGLIFSCNGRGTRLFSQPHHDALAVRQTFGEIPLAGFFAQGEMGPIGKTNFLHGFTASLALFP